MRAGHRRFCWELIATTSPLICGPAAASWPNCSELSRCSLQRRAIRVSAWPRSRAQSVVRSHQARQVFPRDVHSSVSCCITLQTELETMQLIMRLLGTPTGNVWPVTCSSTPAARRTEGKHWNLQLCMVCPQGFNDMPSAQQVMMPNQPYNYLKRVSLCSLQAVLLQQYGQY